MFLIDRSIRQAGRYVGSMSFFIGGCRNGSDACAGEGSGLGEDDDAAFAGDVAFHQVLSQLPRKGQRILGVIAGTGTGTKRKMFPPTL